MVNGFRGAVGRQEELLLLQHCRLTGRQHVVGSFNITSREVSEHSQHKELVGVGGGGCASYPHLIITRCKQVLKYYIGPCKYNCYVSIKK